jgi:hypothetical protein
VRKVSEKIILRCCKCKSGEKEKEEEEEEHSTPSL